MNNEDQDFYDSDDESLFSVVNNPNANDHEGFDLAHPNEAEDAAVNLPPPPVGVAQAAPVIVPPPVELRRQVRFAAAHRFDQPAVPQFQLPVVIPQVPVAIAPPIQVAPPVPDPSYCSGTSCRCSSPHRWSPSSWWKRCRCPSSGRSLHRWSSSRCRQRHRRPSSRCRSLSSQRRLSSSRRRPT